ncbi:MAG: hypothetical protein CMI18_00830 [Opitutaceae bacterium]|nr:hypothetical protein [Opitutaceae bacterium]
MDEAASVHPLARPKLHFLSNRSVCFDLRFLAPLLASWYPPLQVFNPYIGSTIIQVIAPMKLRHFVLQPLFVATICLDECGDQSFPSVLTMIFRYLVKPVLEIGFGCLAS